MDETLTVTLPAELAEKVRDFVRRGRYGSPEELLSSLDQLASSMLQGRGYGETSAIGRSCERLVRFPRLGLVRPGLGAGVRLPIVRGKYVVSYRSSPDHVLVLRLFSRGQSYPGAPRASRGR